MTEEKRKGEEEKKDEDESSREGDEKYKHLLPNVRKTLNLPINDRIQINK